MSLKSLESKLLPVPWCGHQLCRRPTSAAAVEQIPHSSQTHCKSKNISILIQTLYRLRRQNGKSGSLSGREIFHRTESYFPRQTRNTKWSKNVQTQNTNNQMTGVLSLVLYNYSITWFEVAVMTSEHTLQRWRRAGRVLNAHLPLNAI